MATENILPPHLFPSVSWFILGTKQGHFTVGMGGYYEKQSGHSRYSIAAANGDQMLVVPVVHTGAKKELQETHISCKEKWAREHTNAIRSAYGKAPFFEFYDYKILPLLENEQFTLAQLIEASISVLHQYLMPEMPLKFVNEPFSLTEFPSVAEYSQVFEDKFGFRANMSALDLLFNLGPEAEDYLYKAAGGF